MTSPMPSTRPIADRRRAGFTLIELLVVLSLLGILTGLIAPRFRGTVRAVEAEEAAAIVTAHLQTLRAEAARHGRTIELTFAREGSDEIRVVTYDAPAQPAWDFTPIDASERRVGATESRWTVPFDGTISAAPPIVTFHPDGRSTEATLTLHAPDGRATVLELRRSGMAVAPERAR